MAPKAGRKASSKNLYQQDLFQLGITKLSVKSPAMMPITIGKSIGKVGRRKSTRLQFSNVLERHITIKLERLSNTVLEMYRERTAENEEYNFITKIHRGKIRKLSVYNADDSEEPQSKKSKKKKNEPDEYIVEKILKCKYEKGKELFLITWKGWPDSANTWEPIENLNCPKILKEFVLRIEEEYCHQFAKIKTEISYEDLLSEENLLQNLPNIDLSSLFKIKETLITKLLCIYNLKQNENRVPSQLIQDTREIYQLYVVTRKRCRQLLNLKHWEECMNSVDSSKKISVENNEDLEGPPDDFIYIEKSIPGVGVTIPDDPPIGCDCDACNCRSKTCCGTQAGSFAYTSSKLLRVASGVPIYECNKACKCSDNCCNRVVQSGRNVKLTIFRTNNGCGWGVRTDQRIRKGQFVSQYVGEVIVSEEAEKRGKEYDQKGMTYLFDLDFNSSEESYSIDAAKMGNVTHFINHSCDPNLGVWAVWANCLDPNLPMLALFAKRDIEAGEEINFDYLHKADGNTTHRSTFNEGTISTMNGSGAGRTSSPPTPGTSTAGTSTAGTSTAGTSTAGTSTSSNSSPLKSTQQQTITNLRNRTECKCGSVKCRGYLF